MGFGCFFIDTEVPEEKIVQLAERAKELDIDFEFIHGPFKNINTLLMPDMEYREIMNGIKNQ